MADFAEKQKDEGTPITRFREIGLAKSIMGHITWAPAPDASPSREAPMGYEICSLKPYSS